MKKLRNKMLKKIGPAADKFEEFIKFGQSRLPNRKTYVTATYPSDYECRRKEYAAAASGLTIDDWLALRAAIKTSGGQTGHANTGEWIL